MLSFKIDSESLKKMLALNEQIAQKIQKIRSLSDKEREAIYRFARVSTIGASTRIENAILTDSEIDWMDRQLGKDGKRSAFEAKKKQIENKLSKDRERSIEEVAGCRNMLLIIYEQYQEFHPITETQIRGLHGELLRFYSKGQYHRGKYKTITNSVVQEDPGTGEKKMVFETAPPGPLTETAMADLVHWYNEAIEKEPYSLAVACEFTFRFLAIHPFQDGNGRLGRGLFLLSLLQSSSKSLSEITRYLAIDRQIERNKEMYYLTLNRCSEGKYSSDPKQYKMEFFLKFIIKILENSLKDIEIYQKRFARIESLTETEREVLGCFQDRPEKKLSTKEIVKVTGIQERTVRKALSTLIEIEMLQKKGRGPQTIHQLVF